MKSPGQKSLASILVSAFTACSLLPAFGAERVAFVIGNDAYPTFPLDNAVRDATAVRDMLTKDLGFSGEDVVFVTNSTRLALYEKFAIFKNKAADSSIALVYYAGHGMETLNGKENFILPVDADVLGAVESEAALRTGGVNLMTLTKELAVVSSGAKIFLIDACRERPRGRGMIRTGGGLATYADDEIPPDTLMILAAAPKGVASDGERHGPFTAALLEVLPQGGKDLMSAFFAVSDRVQEATQKQQVPWLKFDGSGAIFRANSFLKGSVPEETPVLMGPPVERVGPRMKFTRADLALPHRWVDDSGRETEAVFGGIQGSGSNALVLLKTANDKTAQFPLSKLSPESSELARGLASLQADQPIAGPPAASQPASSPDGSKGDLKFGNSRYRLVRGAFTWTEARKRAEAMGGHLITITSQQEYDWFRSVLPSDILFVALGGQRSRRGEWEWVTGEPWSFTDWGPNEPNGPTDAKLEFSRLYYGKQGGWNDIFDGESSRINLEGRSFMVEWDGNSP